MLALPSSCGLHVWNPEVDVGLVVATLQAAAKQPLLPIVAAHARSNSNGTGTHNRSGSRTPSEVKNGVINKQLLKEPLSPPAGEQSMC